jgi:hypothetical protein
MAPTGRHVADGALEPAAAGHTGVKQMDGIGQQLGWRRGGRIRRAGSLVAAAMAARGMWPGGAG